MSASCPAGAGDPLLTPSHPTPGGAPSGCRCGIAGSWVLRWCGSTRGAKGTTVEPTAAARRKASFTAAWRCSAWSAIRYRARARPCRQTGIPCCASCTNCAANTGNLDTVIARLADGGLDQLQLQTPEEAKAAAEGRGRLAGKPAHPGQHRLMEQPRGRRHHGQPIGLGDAAACGRDARHAPYPARGPHRVRAPHAGSAGGVCQAGGRARPGRDHRRGRGAPPTFPACAPPGRRCPCWACRWKATASRAWTAFCPSCRCPRASRWARWPSAGRGR